MWQFIITGYVPGTEFQITFEIFLLFMLFAFAGILLYFELKQFAHFYIQTFIRKSVNEQEAL